MLSRLSRDLFGNPSGLHGISRQARSVLEESRAALADMLGAGAGDRLVFTSGGSEANALALRGFPSQCPASEHKSVLANCHLPPLPVDEHARLRLEGLAFDPRAEKLAVMLANNELGTVMEPAPLVAWCRERRLEWHCDAVCATGKVPVHFRALGADTLSCAAHKFYGPRGVGLLLARAEARLQPLYGGGGQEDGWRSGTENVAAVAAARAALETCLRRQEGERTRLEGMAEELWQRLRSPDVRRLGEGARLPGHLSLAFRGLQGESLALAVDQAGAAVSTGSACSSRRTGPSHVIQAIGLSEEWSHGNLRISLGARNRAEEIPVLADMIQTAASRLRALGTLV